MDRNIFAGKAPYMENASLSARRAWIEMELAKKAPAELAVALRKESVDRNRGTASIRAEMAKSLSARRAWIEILFRGCYTWIDGLSLSARRAWIEIQPLWPSY